MAETTTLATTTPDLSSTTLPQSINSIDTDRVDDESPVGNQNDTLKGSEYVSNFGEDKEFDESPLMLSPGTVVMDSAMIEQGGYITPSHMLMPVGNIQSKGLPSNGVLGNDVVSPPPVVLDDLKAALMQQVEYYFSKDNLATDKYLLSQMDGDNFVPVAIVASFNQVKRLTTDLDLILEVVKESQVLQLDEQGEKIRAIPEKRCILILREIPQDTPQKDIMALFSGGKCPDFLSCEFAENSCWYVTFESEDDAQKAFVFLREEVQTFLGKPIRARIKGTTVQRSSGMPKKPRVNYPIQPIPRYFPQQPGVIPWPSPPNNAINGVPAFFERGNFYVPASSGGNGFIPQPFGPHNHFQSYPHQMNGNRNPPDHQERGRGHPGGRNHRNDHQFSPPPSLMNGGDLYLDRERGMDRGSRGRGDHIRDHYRGGGPERRYQREDTIQKIPRLSKKNAARLPPIGGPPRDLKDRGSGDEPLPQQSLDLAPGNFPPLPTNEAEGTSPPSLTPTQPIDTSDAKNTSNLADIVKGRRLKETAPTVTVTNHPPLRSTNSSNGNTTTAQGPENTPPSTAPPNHDSLSQAVQTTKPITTNSPTSALSITTPSIPIQTQPPSVAAVVASNIPPVPKTAPPAPTPNTVSPIVSTSAPSVTTAAAVVASGVQSTVTTTSSTHSTTNSSSGQQSRYYQHKGPRGDSKGPYRGDRGYYNNGGKQGSQRHNDKDNLQNRQNSVRNSQVSKDGRSAPLNNRRNRERDREKKGGMGYNKNNASRPSPKPAKKHQPPQAPPPPPTPNTDTKDPTTTKPTNTDRTDDSKSQKEASKSEKLSYAQMAQRKKAPPSPIPPPPPKQDVQSDDSESPTKSSSAPASPKGERKNSKAIIGQSSVTSKQNKPGPKAGSNVDSSLPASSAVSKSAPTSPSKASTGAPEDTLP